ncbi:carbonic anhydrase [Diaporthe sp. PMI_573]|nr:carbonic anhydrase [Diaporthaceae sp. PMI_573]
MIRGRVCSHVAQLPGPGTRFPSSIPSTVGLTQNLNIKPNLNVSRCFQRHCSSHSGARGRNFSPHLVSQTTTKRHLRSIMSDEQISRYLQQTHDRVFEHNTKWAADKKAQDPDFFTNLSAGQKPEYLWIGCSDSRIPAEQITGLEPGEAFVHRNIANLVCNIDLNVASVLNYAVEHLEVKHIVVCGHYGCGGVKAAMTPKDLGILNPWLRNIRDVYRLHEQELDAIADESARYDRLVELNVIEQCRNVVKSAAVQKSYAKNHFPIVHGWVFGFNDGLLKDLNFDFATTLADIQKIYKLAE